MGYLVADNVFKSVKTKTGDTVIINGISMCVEQGEFVSISGKSGAGKTTLLNMLSALTVPTKGAITIDGINTSEICASERAKIRNTKIGVILQDFPLVEKFDVYDNCKLPFFFSNESINIEKQRLDPLLERFGIYKYKNKSVKKLSGGERQRVAIIRALVMDPAIIIADEPTSNLDISNRDLVLDLLFEMKNKGKTVIVASHDRDIIGAASRNILINDGKISNEM